MLIKELCHAFILLLYLYYDDTIKIEMKLQCESQYLDEGFWWLQEGGGKPVPCWISQSIHMR